MKKFVYLILLVGFTGCQSGNKTKEPAQAETTPVQLVETTISVGGMTCDMCVASIEKGVNELQGISYVKASLNDSTAVVKFDASKTNLDEIEKAIEKRGYTIKSQM